MKAVSHLNLASSPTILKEDELSENLDEIVSRGSWEVEIFNKKPYSNEELRNIIIPSVLEVFVDTASINSADWQSLIDFPDPVLKWLKGQKQILFPHIQISSFEDLIDSLRSLLSSGTGFVKDLLNEILVFQKSHLDQVEGNHQQWWHSRFDGSEIEVVCNNCDQSLNTDESPRWSINRPGFYVVRQTTCSYKNCGVRTTLAIPKDKSLNIVSGHSGQTISSSTSRTTESPLLMYQRVKEAEDSDLPSTVECWCFQCNDEATFFDDREPRWTIGHPLYIEREKECKNCSKDRLGDSEPTKKRYIPRDPRILSIIPSSLRGFHYRYEFLGREAHKILITKDLASSREPRGQNKKRQSSSKKQSASKRAKKGN